MADSVPDWITFSAFPIPRRFVDSQALLTALIGTGFVFSAPRRGYRPLSMLARPGLMDLLNSNLDPRTSSYLTNVDAL